MVAWSKTAGSRMALIAFAACRGQHKTVSGFLCRLIFDDLCTLLCLSGREGIFILQEVKKYAEC